MSRLAIPQPPALTILRLSVDIVEPPNVIACL